MENNTEINQCKKPAQKKISKEIKSHNFCHSKDERAISNWGAIEKKMYFGFTHNIVANYRKTIEGGVGNQGEKKRILC